MECARNYKTGKNINKKAFVKEDILSFINDKKNKISTRNILGVIKNDDWLNLFNIGNIMFLYAMSYDDLDLDSDESSKKRNDNGKIITTDENEINKDSKLDNKSKSVYDERQKEFLSYNSHHIHIW